MSDEIRFEDPGPGWVRMDSPKGEFWVREMEKPSPVPPLFTHKIMTTEEMIADGERWKENRRREREVFEEGRRIEAERERIYGISPEKMEENQRLGLDNRMKEDAARRREQEERNRADAEYDRKVNEYHDYWMCDRDIFGRPAPKMPNPPPWRRD